MRMMQMCLSMLLEVLLSPLINWSPKRMHLFWQVFVMDVTKSLLFCDQSHNPRSIPPQHCTIHLWPLPLSKSVIDAADRYNVVGVKMAVEASLVDCFHP